MTNPPRGATAQPCLPQPVRATIPTAKPAFRQHAFREQLQALRDGCLAGPSRRGIAPPWVAGGPQQNAVGQSVEVNQGLTNKRTSDDSGCPPALADSDATEGRHRRPEECPSGDPAPGDCAQGEIPWGDPTSRSLLHWAQRAGAAPPAAVLPPVGVLEQVAAQLLRKAAVGPSSVRLELGEGNFQGSQLLIQSGPDGLDVNIQAPPGIDAEGLGQAIERRLVSRGLKVSRVVVE